MEGGCDGGVCAWVVELVGFAIWVAEVLVTLVVSWEVFVRSTITGLSVGLACNGDAKLGGPFSSGALRLVVSLIRWEVGESSRFGAF